MDDNTFIFLYRKSIKSRVFQNEGLWKIWTWCLMKASHKKRWTSVKVGRAVMEVEILSGQFIFGRDSASKQLKMNPNTIWKRMQKLKSMQNLTIESNSKYSIISIINWDTYQTVEKESNSKSNSRVTAEQQPSNTDNNVKKERKEIYSRVITYLNKKTGKDFKENSKATISFINARLGEGYTPEDFKSVIDVKTSQWLHDPENNKYLRPQTLFGTKFESYLNEKIVPVNGDAKLTKDELLKKHGITL